MARIPTDDELGEPVPGPGRGLEQFSGAERSQLMEPARAMAETGAAIGRAGKRIGVMLEPKEDPADEYEVTKTLLQFDREQERAYDEARRGMPEGGDGFADGYRTRYDEAARGVMRAAKERGLNRRSLEKLDEGLLRWGEKLHTKAWRDELDERDRFHTADIEQQILDVQSRAAEMPDRLPDHIAGVRQLIRSSKLPLTKKADLERKVPALIEEVAARALMERDPEEAIRRLLVRPTGDPSRAPAYSAKGDRKSQEAIASVAADVGEDAAKMLAIADIESNGTFSTSSSNPRSSARGIFHFLDENRRWAAANGTPYGDDPESQTKAMAAKMASDRRIFERAADREPEPWEEYILHFQGGPMGTRLLIAPANAPLEQVLGARAKAILDANPNLKKYRTVGDFREDYKGIFNRRMERFAGAGEVSREELPDVGADAGVVSDGVEVAERVAEAWTESEAAPFRHLPYLKRQSLLRVAQTALRDTVGQEVLDDIERVRDGRRPAMDQRGRTSLDRARLVMTPNQLAKFQRQWDEAEHEARVVLPLANMSEEEAAAHLEQFDPGQDTGTESYKTKDAVFTKAVRAWEKIDEERKKDFAAAVDSAPEVRSARESLRQKVRVPISDGVEVADQQGPMGRVAPQMAWESLIDARLKAQRRLLGIQDGDTTRDYELKVITRDEARKLLRMPDDLLRIDDREFRRKLKEAADRAERDFGPKYARQAFETAARYLLTSTAEADEVQTVVRRTWRDAVAGERASSLTRMMMDGIVTPDDERRAREMVRASRAEQAMEGQPVGTRAEQQRPPGMTPRLEAMSRTAETAARYLLTSTAEADEVQTVRPNEKQKQWLRENPSAWETFEKKFGPGAAAEALSRDSSQQRQR